VEHAAGVEHDGARVRRHAIDRLCSVVQRDRARGIALGAREDPQGLEGTCTRVGVARLVGDRPRQFGQRQPRGGLTAAPLAHGARQQHVDQVARHPPCLLAHDGQAIGDRHLLDAVGEQFLGRELALDAPPAIGPHALDDAALRAETRQRIPRTRR
jgi:hypothetical protein